MQLFYLIVAMNGLPTGAPKCQIVAGGIAAGHGSPPDATLGYTLSYTQIATGFTIKINNPQKSSFKGVLMYVTTDNSPLVHLGKFTFGPGFKQQDTSICQAAQVTGDALATFTHSDPTDKSTDLVFAWTGSVIAGLRVHTVIATLPSTPSNAKPGTPRWQIVEMALLQTNTSASPTCQKPIMKCVPKNWRLAKWPMMHEYKLWMDSKTKVNAMIITSSCAPTTSVMQLVTSCAPTTVIPIATPCAPDSLTPVATLCAPNTAMPVASPCGPTTVISIATSFDPTTEIPVATSCAPTTVMSISASCEPTAVIPIATSCAPTLAPMPTYSMPSIGTNLQPNIMGYGAM